jgi:hypothetical protein
MNLSANKFDNLDEMDRFLERCKLPSLFKKSTDKLDSFMFVENLNL